MGHSNNLGVQVGTILRCGPFKLSTAGCQATDYNILTVSHTHESISGMGFPPARVARATLRYTGDNTTQEVCVLQLVSYSG